MPDPVTPDPTNDPQPDPPASETPPESWDAYVATLADDDARTLVNSLRDKWHEEQVTGLKSALDKERDNASEASKALRKLAKEADEKTAAELNKLADEKDAAIDDARKEGAFYREAAQAGVPADKLARAWLLCKNADYFTKRGDPDIASMKADIPELFAVATPPTPKINAGPGTRQPAAPVEQDPLRAAVDRARGITRI